MMTKILCTIVILLISSCLTCEYRDDDYCTMVVMFAQGLAQFGEIHAL